VSGRSRRSPASGRGRLGIVMAAGLIVGLVLLVGFEGAVARIVGVAGMLAFIVSGVFLIADPEFLGEERPPEG
jgi:hypothetical protein